MKIRETKHVWQTESTTKENLDTFHQIGSTVFYKQTKN